MTKSILHFFIKLKPAALGQSQLPAPGLNLLIMSHLCLKKKKSAAKRIDNLQVSKIVFVPGSPAQMILMEDPVGTTSLIRQPRPRRWVAADSFGPLERALDACQVVCKILKCLKQYSLYNVIKYWGG